MQENYLSAPGFFICIFEKISIAANNPAAIRVTLDSTLLSVDRKRVHAATKNNTANLFISFTSDMFVYALLKEFLSHHLWNFCFNIKSHHLVIVTGK